MAEKFLRGRAPLTFYRAAGGGQGGSLYRGDVIPAERVDIKDTDRLVGEGFIERVTRDGEDFILAEDTATGDKGDSVHVGDSSTPPADEVDNGLVNLDQRTAADEATEQADQEADQKRAAARQKLTEMGGEPDGRSSQEVWVEYLVSRGSRYDDIKDVKKDELRKLADQQKS